MSIPTLMTIVVFFTTMLSHLGEDVLRGGGHLSPAVPDSIVFLPALFLPPTPPHPACSPSDFSIWSSHESPTCSVVNGTRLQQSTALLSVSSVLDLPVPHEFIPPSPSTAQPTSATISSPVPLSRPSYRLVQDGPTPPFNPSVPPLLMLFAILLSCSFYGSILVIAWYRPHICAYLRSLAFSLITSRHIAPILDPLLPYRRIALAAAFGSYQRTIRILENRIKELVEQALFQEKEAKRILLSREAELQKRITVLAKELAKLKRQYAATSKMFASLWCSLLDSTAPELFNPVSDDLMVNVCQLETVFRNQANKISAMRIDLQQARLRLERYTDARDGRMDLVTVNLELERQLERSRASVEREAAERLQAQSDNLAHVDTINSLRQQLEERDEHLKQRDVQITSLQDDLAARPTTIPSSSDNGDNGNSSPQPDGEQELSLQEQEYSPMANDFAEGLAQSSAQPTVNATPSASKSIAPVASSSSSTGTISGEATETAVTANLDTQRPPSSKPGGKLISSWFQSSPSAQPLAPLLLPLSLSLSPIARGWRCRSRPPPTSTGRLTSSLHLLSLPGLCHILLCPRAPIYHLLSPACSALSSAEYLFIRFSNYPISLTTLRTIGSLSPSQRILSI
ncbi:hypothetical protein EVG20_g983 [Dentipellis fragilis]|uniref:Uncharacterized protein n=1 Tax=Dentipellis fragilis TaxID=205917 RepID=A0A4Y9ZDV2_9AGAM|nr:hypothetical protein EVG20_g983 [Dentipellis fragilis]